MHKSRKTGVLGTTKKFANKSLSFLEKGVSGLFGVVKSGVNMSVKGVKRTASMITKRRKHRKMRRGTRRMKKH